MHQLTQDTEFRLLIVYTDTNNKNNNNNKENTSLYYNPYIHRSDENLKYIDRYLPNTCIN